MQSENRVFDVLFEAGYPTGRQAPMPPSLDYQAHVFTGGNPTVLDLLHVGVRDDGVTAALPIHGFEGLGRCSSLVGFSLVYGGECSVGEFEYGAPHGVAGFGSHRRE